MILDHVYAGDRPRGLFRSLALAPGVDVTLQSHLVVCDVDLDCSRFNESVPLQCCLYPMFDIDDICLRLDFQNVDNTDDPAELLDRVFRGLPLEMPRHFPGKRDPTFVNLDVNRGIGKCGIP